MYKQIAIYFLNSAYKLFVYRTGAKRSMRTSCSRRVLSTCKIETCFGMQRPPRRFGTGSVGGIGISETCYMWMSSQ